MFVTFSNVLTLHPSEKRVKILHTPVLFFREPEIILYRYLVLPTTDEFFFRVAYEGELIEVPDRPSGIRHGRTVYQRPRLTVRSKVVVDGTRSDLIVSKPDGLVAVAIRHEKALLPEKLQDVLIPIKVPEFVRYFAKVQFHVCANVVLKYMNLP